MKNLKHTGGGGGGGGGAITKHMCSACMQNKLIRYCIIKGKAPLRQKCGGNFPRGPVHPTHRRENIVIAMATIFHG